MRKTPTPRTHRLEALLALLSASGNSSGTRTAFTTPALFVDPANSSGHASDMNSGLDAAHPIQTTARLNQLLANKFIDFANGLAFVGSPVTLRSGSFTAVQAIAPATNTRERVTDAAVASWAADVGNFVVDTTAGGNFGNSAPVMHDVGGGSHQADLGRPVGPGGGGGAFAALDTYAIKRGSNLALGAITPVFQPIDGLPAGTATITYMSDDASGTPLDLSTTALSGLAFTDFSFVTVGFLGSAIIDSVGTAFKRCIFADNVGTFVSMNLNNIISLSNCILLQGAATQLGAFSMSAGGSFSQVTGVFVAISGDAYFTTNLNVSPSTLLVLFLQAGIGGGIQIQDVPGGADALIISGGTADMSSGRIWGSGNTGTGITISPGASAIVSASTPPIISGLHDFSFVGQNGGAQVFTGRPWNEAGDVYGAAAATTWANFVGAAFGFQAHDVATGASIVGV